MKTLQTDRLRLVPVTAHNAGLLWHLLQQPDLRRFQDLPSVGIGAFSTLVGKRPKELRANAAGRFEWLIYPDGRRKPAGWISLRIAERDPANGEIGYTLLRDFRGRGFALEAVRALLDEVFERAGMSKVNAYCVPANSASRRLLKRLGFRYDGVLPHGATVAGQAVDVLTHSLHRDQWLASGNSMVMPASAYPA
jgi:ribosomal-protein-alanine N-acetyltransferase